jgi:hypothetical protein
MATQAQTVRSRIPESGALIASGIASGIPFQLSFKEQAIGRDAATAAPPATRDRP